MDDRHIRVLVTLRAIAAASIFLILPGCASLSSRGSRADPPAPTVRALSASMTGVTEAPDPVRDDEVSAAQAALRDASVWGAEYYEPQMYARARAAFDAALAARHSDPARCRSLLAQAADASQAAREAALSAYEKDVAARFEASRAELVELGAQRAFPDEFARLVSGIDATDSLFAAGSYWNARFKAYNTLRGMSALSEKVRGLVSWLKSARIQVEKALDTAQALDAPQWAPTEMENARQKYHDAVTQMQAGDLKAAVDSMKTAGLIAMRLPYLKDTIHGREASVPPTARPALPTDREIQGPPAALQPPSARSSLSGQRVRIADMSMSSLGAPPRSYSAFSAAVARFDLVAAEGLRDAGVMEKVLSGMDDGWEAAISRKGYFGFIYSDKIEMVRDLDTYPGNGEFLHAPYAAQFRLVGTRFAVNLVLCHVETGKGPALKEAEIKRLADVYRYYENLTGNKGITLVLAGGLSDVPEQASQSLIPHGDMVSLQTNADAPEGRHDKGQRVFASVPLRPLIEESGFASSALPVAYVVLKTDK